MPTKKQEQQPVNKREKFAANVKSGIDPNPKLKRGVIFPRNRHEEGGFVLTQEDAINCGWLQMPEKWQTYTTSDLEKLPAMIFQEMRVCVVASTPNYAQDRDSGDLLGIIDWATYEHDPDTAKVCQNYLLLLLDENYQPLHKRALHYKAHGNAGLSFTQAFVGSNERKGFYQEMDAALREFWVQEGIEFEDEDVYKTHFNSVQRVAEPYHNCSVIHMKFGVALKGQGTEKAMVVVVEDWEHPTADNFDQFYRDELKPTLSRLLSDSEGWSRKVMKMPKAVHILPYVPDGDVDLKSALPAEPPY